jgi:hypothetical protein
LDRVGALRPAVLTAGCLALPCVGLAADRAMPTEQEVKVAFLYHFARFVEWPAHGASSGTEFEVAVLASDEYWAVAKRTLAGKTAGALPLALRRISEPSAASKARILFVGAADANNLPEILRAIDGNSVLTIGDSEGFAERGGMIGFRIVDNRVRFDINLEQATRSGLKISSEVLKLARLVRTREGK